MPRAIKIARRPASIPTAAATPPSGPHAPPVAQSGPRSPCDSPARRTRARSPTRGRRRPSIQFHAECAAHAAYRLSNAMRTAREKHARERHDERTTRPSTPGLRRCAQPNSRLVTRPRRPRTDAVAERGEQIAARRSPPRRAPRGSRNDRDARRRGERASPASPGRCAASRRRAAAAHASADRQRRRAAAPRRARAAVRRAARARRRSTVASSIERSMIAVAASADDERARCEQMRYLVRRARRATAADDASMETADDHAAGRSGCRKASARASRPGERPHGERGHRCVRSARCVAAGAAHRAPRRAPSRSPRRRTACTPITAAVARFPVMHRRAARAPPSVDDEDAGDRRERALREPRTLRAEPARDRRGERIREEIAAGRAESSRAMPGAPIGANTGSPSAPATR